MINFYSFKKKIFYLDKLFLNSNLLKFYDFVKYNYKLFIISNRKKTIQSKKHFLKKKLIISLTSYPKRFRTLPLVLNSLINQSIKADKIILWIEKKDKEKIPSQILNFKEIQLEICENDLFSYKKIIPALKKYKNCYIITFDDDVIYFRNSVEKLVKESKKYPKDIIANCIHKIKFINSFPIRYKLWSRNYKKQTKHAFFTGGAGVLFPPNCFYKDVSKKNFFMKITPAADDIWLNWMAKLKGTKIRYSSIKRNYEFIKLIKGGLYKKNVKQNFNDIQIKNIIKKYGFPYQV